MATTPAGPDVAGPHDGERPLAVRSDAVSPSAVSARPSKCSARLPGGQRADARRTPTASGGRSRLAGQATDRRRAAAERQHRERGEQHRRAAAQRSTVSVGRGPGSPSACRPPAARPARPSLIRGVGRRAAPCRAAARPRSAAAGPRRPRRCPRRAAGRGRAPARARACPARATAPARWSGARRRTRRPHPGRVRSAVSAHGHRHQPVEQHRYAGLGGGDQEAGPGREVGAAQRGQASRPGRRPGRRRGPAPAGRRAVLCASARRRCRCRDR